MRSWKAALSFSRLDFTLFHFNQWPRWSNAKFKTRPQQAFVPNEKMENNKYKRSKEILLQAYLAGKGARAGQGKGGGVEKERDWNQWLFTFYAEALHDG